MDGALMLREASDAALSNASAASWHLHIHPAHPDNYPSFYQPLKESFVDRISEVCPASSLQPPSRPPAPQAKLSPNLASGPLSPQVSLFGPQRQVYVYLHVLAAEETKESYLPVNKTPSSTNWQTEGPLGPSAIQPEAAPCLRRSF